MHERESLVRKIRKSGRDSEDDFWTLIGDFWKWIIDTCFFLIDIKEISRVPTIYNTQEFKTIRHSKSIN